MADHGSDPGAHLDDVRRRRRRLLMRRAWTLGAAAAAVCLGTAALAAWLVRPGAGPSSVMRSRWPRWPRPAADPRLVADPAPAADLQIARLVEERNGGLDDGWPRRSNTANVPGTTRRWRRCWPAMRPARSLVPTSIWSPATRSVAGAARGRRRDARAARRGRRVHAADRQAAGVAAAYLFPARSTLSVEPGNARVRAGQALTVSVRLAGVEGGIVRCWLPAVATARAQRMTATGEPGASRSPSPT